MQARPAVPADAEAICAIYNQGIEEHAATFETRLRSPDDIHHWFDGRHPLVVAIDGGEVVAFAATFPYRPRDCFRGVAEFSVYVARGHRGRGAGTCVMRGLIAEAERMGLWKIESRIFPENSASRALARKLGFREVGTYRKHARLDGRWRDVVIVEYLIERNLD